MTSGNACLSKHQTVFFLLAGGLGVVASTLVLGDFVVIWKTLLVDIIALFMSRRLSKLPKASYMAPAATIMVGYIVAELWNPGSMWLYLTMSFTLVPFHLFLVHEAKAQDPPPGPGSLR